MSTPRILALAFALPALLLVGGAVAAPLVERASVREAAGIIYRLTCHGRESRALWIEQRPMPICARCTGIWAGVAGGALLFAAGLTRHPRLTGRIVFLVVLPLAIDGITQAAGLRESSNLLRLATGFPAGMIPIMWALQVSGIRSQVSGVRDQVSGIR